MFVIHGKHGNQKFELALPSTTTISDLCVAIEKETQLPIHCQRVIYNGRALNSQKEDLLKDLQSMGLKTPAKILVLGKKADQEDENYQEMKKWENLCDSVSRELSGYHEDVQDMEKGYASDQLLKENLPKMEKKINCLAEELMRVLISLDGLTFTETQKESRAKRKSLIDRIHSLHDKCDRLTQSIQQLKIDHKI